jgi:hypothetical protein
MWLPRRGAGDCAKAHDVIEQFSGVEQSLDAVNLHDLLGELPADVRSHVSACSDCRTFAAEFLEVRTMLRGAETGPQPGPYFMARVMATISEREVDLERSSQQAWAAVPRLAYRLSVLASLSLLFAVSWLYQHPRHTTVSVAEQNSEGLVESNNGGIQDDFLLNPADR